MVTIARLDPVNLRDVWPNEASDFTPWLAENLDALGEALGMDLELQQTEAPVGRFSVDILAKDVNENRDVVIENQLEPTNHDHLGKVLTYAAGRNADVMVWIVKDFLDEHRQALDYLNRRTIEGTLFYGIVVRAVSIDGSRPAFVFDVVVRPNEFGKSSVSVSGAEQPNPRGQAYQAFWPQVLDRLRDEHKLTGVRKPSARSYVGFKTGLSGLGCVVTFPKQGARTELYIDMGNQPRNKRLFDFLHADRERIEKVFGEALSWERLDNRRASRIAVYLPNRTIDDAEDTLAATADWMVERAVRLMHDVVPIVGEAIADLGSAPPDDALDFDEDDDA